MSEQPAEPAQPKRKRHGCLFGLLGFFALIVVIIVIAAASSGGGGSSGSGKAAAVHCSSYKTVSATAWGQITKNPDAHKGECLTVYGQVTQFDSATGTSTFRADSGRSHLALSYGFVNYTENAIFDGSASQLNNVVQGDLFTAHVSVSGHADYDNVMGGSDSVPEFQVHSIKVTGHLND